MKQQLKKIFAMSMAITMSVTNLVSATDVVTVSQNSLKSAPPQVTEENGITSIDVASILGTSTPTQAVSENNLQIPTNIKKDLSVSQNSISHNSTPILKSYIGGNSFGKLADSSSASTAMLIGDGIVFKDKNGKYYETPVKTDDTYYYWLDKAPTLKSEYKDIYYNTHLALSELSVQGSGFFSFGDGSGEYYLGTNEYRFTEENDNYYGVKYINKTGQVVPYIKFKSAEGFYSDINRINAGYNGIAVTAPLYEHIAENDFRYVVDTIYRYNQNEQKIYHEDGRYFAAANVTKDYLAVLDTTDATFKILVINPETNQKIKEFELDNSSLSINDYSTLGIFAFKNSNTILLHKGYGDVALKINLDTQQQTNIPLPGTGCLISNSDFTVYTNNDNDSYNTKFHYSVGDNYMRMFEKTGLAISADSQKGFYAVYPYSHETMNSVKIVVNDMDAQTALGFDDNDYCIFEPRLYSQDPFSSRPVAENVSYFGTKENTVLPNTPKYWVFQTSYPYLNFNRPSDSNLGSVSMSIDADTMFTGLIDGKINPYAAVNQFICTASSRNYAPFGIYMITKEEGAPDNQFIGSLSEDENCEDVVYHIDYTSIFDPSIANTMTDEEKQAALPIIQSRMEKIPGYHEHNNEINTFFYDKNTDGTVVDPGSCTTPKKIRVNCAICGKVSIKEDTSEMHHQYEYPDPYDWGSWTTDWEEIVPATCQTHNIKTVICHKCHEPAFELDEEYDPSSGENIDDFIAEHGHNTTEFEDYQAGQYNFGDLYYITDQTAAPEYHSSFGSAYATEPTCTEPGTFDLHCQYCGREVYKTNAEYYQGFEYHANNNNITNEEREGFTVNPITGKYYKDETSAPALGHDFSSEEIIRPATCTRTGIKNCTCERCNETVRQTIDKIGHDFTVTHVVSESTCTEHGLANVKCEKCGLVLSRYALPLKDHQWERVWDKCSICEKTKTSDEEGICFANEWNRVYEDSSAKIRYNFYNHTDDNAKVSLSPTYNSSKAEDVDSKLSSVTGANAMMQISDATVYAMTDEKMNQITIDGQSVADFLGTQSQPSKLQITDEYWDITGYDMVYDGDIVLEGFIDPRGIRNRVYDNSFEYAQPPHLGMVMPVSNILKDGKTMTGTRLDTAPELTDTLFETIKSSDQTNTVLHPENAITNPMMYCVINVKSKKEGSFIFDSLPTYLYDGNGQYFTKGIRKLFANGLNPLYKQIKYYKLTTYDNQSFSAQQSDNISANTKQDNYYLVAVSIDLSKALDYSSFYTETYNGGNEFLCSFEPFTGYSDDTSITATSVETENGNNIALDYSVTVPGKEGFTGYKTGLVKTKNADDFGFSKKRIWMIAGPQTPIALNDGDYYDFQYEDVSNIIEIPFTDYDAAHPAYEVYLLKEDGDPTDPSDWEQVNDNQIIDNIQYHFKNFIDTDGDGQSDGRGFSVFATTTQNIDETVQKEIKIVCKDTDNLLSRPDETFFGTLTIDNIDADVTLSVADQQTVSNENIVSVSGNTVTVLRGQPVTYKMAAEYLKARTSETMDILDEDYDHISWALITENAVGEEEETPIRNDANYLNAQSPIKRLFSSILRAGTLSGLIGADGTLTFKLAESEAKLKVTLDGRYGSDSYIITLKSANPPKKLTADYTGPAVLVTTDYDPTKVKLTLTMTDGTMKDISFSDVTVTPASMKVNNVGVNANIYRATLKADPSLFDDFEVSGIRVVTSIAAVYTGDPIPVGGNYDKGNVTVTVTYNDGTTAIVPDWTPSSLSVTTVGNNSYTATYSGKTATYTVPGVLVPDHITATYTGAPIKKGENYNKDDVTVTLHYHDTSTKVLTKTEWTESSLVVNNVGNNDYTATYSYIDLAGDPKTLTDTYSVTGYRQPVSITAVYTGAPIPTGSDYNKSDVLVKVQYHDGTEETVPVANWTESGLTVTSVGDNTYTATYGTLTKTYTVPGIKTEDHITATYTGPSIELNNPYTKSDVTVTLYYHDGSSKVLAPAEWTPSSLIVTKKGDNDYTATYKTMTAPYKVPGKLTATAMTAVYTGPAIPTGSDYDKSNVTLTIHYTDDTTTVITDPTAWTESGLTVTTVGPNAYTATYGGFTANYDVPGIKVEDHISAVYAGPSIKTGNPYDKDDVTVTLYYHDNSTKTLTTAEWTESGLIVTAVGNNTFTATYGTLKDTYQVPGHKEKVSLTATYSGPVIQVGNNYSKDDVKVTVTYHDGSTEDIPSANWTESGLTVTKTGPNEFTATYTGLNAKYTVPGDKTAKSISAVYTGPAIGIGKDYAKADVTVVLEWSDGTKETLLVSQWAASSLKVTKDGPNTFTATYGTLKDTYVVPGKKAAKSITAKYNGPVIRVGNDYDKKDVTVTLLYDDGSTDTLTQNQWDASSLKVTKDGANEFIATYKADKKLEATYTVTGKKKATGITAKYTGDAIETGKKYKKAKVLVTVTYNDGSTKTLEEKDWTESGLIVKKAGSNTFTATWTDEDKETLKANYTVPGKKVIDKIVATYKGSKILVGKKYDKKDVVVRLYYTDGTKILLDEDDWKESSLKVTKEGDNSFTATYKSKKAIYKVPGYKEKEKEQDKPQTTTITKTTKKPPKTGDETPIGLYLILLLLSALGLGYGFTKFRKPAPATPASKEEDDTDTEE